MRSFAWHVAPRHAHSVAPCSLAAAPPAFSLPLSPRVPAHTRALPGAPESRPGPCPPQASRQQPPSTGKPACRTRARKARQQHSRAQGCPELSPQHTQPPRPTPDPLSRLAPDQTPSDRASSLACPPSQPAQTPQPQAAPAAQRSAAHARGGGLARSGRGLCGRDGRAAQRTRAGRRRSRPLCLAAAAAFAVGTPPSRRPRSRRGPYSPGASGVAATRRNEDTAARLVLRSRARARQPRRRSGTHGRPGRAPAPRPSHVAAGGGPGARRRPGRRRLTCRRRRSPARSWRPWSRCGRRPGRPPARPGGRSPWPPGGPRPPAPPRSAAPRPRRAAGLRARGARASGRARARALGAGAPSRAAVLLLALSPRNNGHWPLERAATARPAPLRCRRRCARRQRPVHWGHVERNLAR